MSESGNKSAKTLRPGARSDQQTAYRRARELRDIGFDLRCVADMQRYDLDLDVGCDRFTAANWLVPLMILGSRKTAVRIMRGPGRLRPASIGSNAWLNADDDFEAS